MMSVKRKLILMHVHSHFFQYILEHKTYKLYHSCAAGRRTTVSELLKYLGGEIKSWTELNLLLLFISREGLVFSGQGMNLSIITAGMMRDWMGISGSSKHWKLWMFGKTRTALSHNTIQPALICDADGTASGTMCAFIDRQFGSQWYSLRGFLSSWTMENSRHKTDQWDQATWETWLITY